jgi:multiple sugar transport system substrate-binding protein
VAAMPNWGATPSNGNWGGSTTVVFKDSKHPAQAEQFAEWLNTNQSSITGLITQGGLYPADVAGEQQPAANSPVAFYGGQNIWKVFQAGGKLVNTSFQWGPIMSTTFTQMQDGFGTATGGSSTLNQVLTSTQAQTVSSMKQQGFSVKS